MGKNKNTRPGVTPIAWALMEKWSAADSVPIEALNERFDWAVELAKAYVKASSVVIERQVGAFL